MRFSFLYISQTFSFFPRREMTCFTDFKTEQFNFFFLCPNSSQQFNSSIVSTYYASQTTDCKLSQQEKGLKQLKSKKEMQSKENNEQIKSNKQSKSKLKRSTKPLRLKIKGYYHGQFDCLGILWSPLSRTLGTSGVLTGFQQTPSNTSHSHLTETPI